MVTKGLFKIKGVKKDVEMELKNSEEIENCPEGTIIIINYCTGKFDGMDDDTVRLKSLSNGYTIGFKIHTFDEYWQECK